MQDFWFRFSRFLVLLGRFARSVLVAPGATSRGARAGFPLLVFLLGAPGTLVSGRAWRAQKRARVFWAAGAFVSGSGWRGGSQDRRRSAAGGGSGGWERGGGGWVGAWVGGWVGVGQGAWVHRARRWRVGNGAITPCGDVPPQKLFFAAELGRDCSVLIPGRENRNIFVARSQKVMQRAPVWKTLACAVGTDLG